MIKLIASDLDGTIVNDDNTISENNIKAIQDIHDMNIPFVICTGKTYPIIKNSCQRLQADYGIFGNGNHIMNLQTGEDIYKKCLSHSEIKDCIEIAKKHRLHVHLYTTDSILTEELKYMDLRNFKLKNSAYYNSSIQFEQVTNLQAYLHSHPTLDVLKLVISAENSLEPVNEEILNTMDLGVCRIRKYGSYRDKVIDKEYEYLDVTPKQISKHDALSILSNYLHLQEQDIMALGDNLNDLDMIRHSGIGVAVANAYDEVKQVASYTTTANVEQGAFAEAIYKFIPFEQKLFS